MEVRQYLDVLRRRRWLIVGVIIAAVLGALAYSFIAPRVYQGESTVLIDLQSTGTTLIGGQAESPILPDRILETQIGLIMSRPVAMAVGKSLGLSASPQALLSQVDAQGDTTTNFVTIDVQDRDPVMAAKLANAFAEQYVAYSRDAKRASIRAAAAQVQLSLDQALKRIATLAVASSGSGVQQAELQAAHDSYNSLADKVQQLRIQEQLETGLGSVVSTAVPASTPVSPNPVKNVALALSVGALAALGLAFVVDALDGRIRTATAISEAYDAPVLARIPKDDSGDADSRSLAVVERPASAVAEAYRSLRNSIQFINFEHTIKTVIVASAEPHEGKSTVAANLAAVLAQAGWKVVLVVSDFRRPVTQEFFHVDDSIGLSDILAHGKAIDDALQPVPGLTNLRVLSAGKAPPNPSEMLGSKKMAEVMARLSGEADWVIVDTAPLLAVADAAAIVRWSDCVLVVGRSGVSRREGARRAREQLQRVGARVLGVAAMEAEPASSARGYGVYTNGA